MLSILIPIYNYHVFPLVSELHKQCVACSLDFEILCQDDASHSNLNVLNEKVNALSNCSFVTLPKNIGHRENRNTLAEQAKYDYLLFIDGDSNSISPNYIQKNVESILDFDVVYGGRLHPEICPSANQKLRWKYGKYKEDKTVLNRKKSPYQSLLFNNTLIRKKWFDRVKFDKNLKKYGHDDTQISYQLKTLGAAINHIDNPVEHGDIDTNIEYLKKSKEALENLVTLYEEKKIDPQFIPLLALFDFLKKLKLTFIISKTYGVFEKLIFKNLKGKHPNLLVFNAFRIGFLCTLDCKSN